MLQDIKRNLVLDFKKPDWKLKLFLFDPLRGTVRIRVYCPITLCKTSFSSYCAECKQVEVGNLVETFAGYGLISNSTLEFLFCFEK